MTNELPPQMLIARLREIAEQLTPTHAERSMDRGPRLHFDGCWRIHRECAIRLAADTLTGWPTKPWEPEW